MECPWFFFLIKFKKGLWALNKFAWRCTVEIRDLNPVLDYKEVHRVYKAAFAGFPWHEDLSNEEVDRRLSSQFAMPGLSGFVLIEDDAIVGVHWHSILSLDSLVSERGPALVDWVTENVSGQPLIIWERELIVHPDYQRRGNSHWLRAAFLSQLHQASTDQIVLTRLRDDNIGSIKSAERIGMIDTGVTKPASEEGRTHHYWALRVTPED